MIGNMQTLPLKTIQSEARDPQDAERMQTGSDNARLAFYMVCRLPGEPQYVLMLAKLNEYLGSSVSLSRCGLWSSQHKSCQELALHNEFIFKPSVGFSCINSGK